MPQGVLPLGQDLLPRQTMNNIVAALCQEGLLTEASPAVKAGKRPTCSPPPGAAYSAKHLTSLNAIEDCAAELFGPERIRVMAGLVMEYDRAPETALGEMEP
ncbi:hypothetical protein [uncultured Gemmiger sp.]|uniref:hypothetical protein n=1 Tax=uncultured Gemmiger sp. TaxID=1623490 RepID=UPI0025F9F5A7|nr:hypothetical protein [uncultured Gemmiger sp.]